MLKREITYTNFDDEEVTEPYYFNLTKAELVEMEVDIKGGLGKFLQRIVDEQDNREIFRMVKEIILGSYGEKSPDGKQFVKTLELSEGFSHTAAFDALIVEFMTDSEAAATFIEAVMPKDMEEFVKKVADQDKPKPPESQTT